MNQDVICSYCGRRADHAVGSATVCDSLTCEREAQRETQVPLADLLARYGDRGA